MIDPARGIDQELDLLIEGQRIAQVAAKISAPDAQVIDAAGLLVVPGLIDLHVHLREPGQEWKETIETGSRAAAQGGFTTVACEPNTEPPVDSAQRVKDILQRARGSLVNLYPKACISKGRQGQELVDVAAVKQAGAVALSDDGDPVMDEGLMLAALQAAKQNRIAVTPHCEESPASRERESPAPDRPPFWREAELIGRDLELAKQARSPIHFSHVSLKESVEIIREAKERDLAVTAEASPHHATLSRADVSSEDADAKVNPPLRDPEDVAAVRQGLADGTIDVIASDHAPHSPEEKGLPYDQAPFGVIGLETTLGVVLSKLVGEGVLSLSDALAKLTINPARVLGLPLGSLESGAQANLTLIDPEATWVVDANQFQSKSRNCPFHGWELRGRAEATIVGGKIVMTHGRIVSRM